LTHFPTTVPRIEPQHTNPVPLPILTNTSQSGLSPLASCEPPSALRRYGSTGGPYAVRTGALLPPTNSTKSTLATHWRSESLPQVCRARHALCLRGCGVSVCSAPTSCASSWMRPSAVTSPINQSSPGAWRLPVHHSAEARPLPRNISVGTWRLRCRRPRGKPSSPLSHLVGRMNAVRWPRLSRKTSAAETQGKDASQHSILSRGRRKQSRGAGRLIPLLQAFALTAGKRTSARGWSREEVCGSVWGNRWCFHTEF